MYTIADQAKGSGSQQHINLNPVAEEDLRHTRLGGENTDGRGNRLSNNTSLSYYQDPQAQQQQESSIGVYGGRLGAHRPGLGPFRVVIGRFVSFRFISISFLL
jgi:hypothetical protein